MNWDEICLKVGFKEVRFKEPPHEVAYYTAPDGNWAGVLPLPDMKSISIWVVPFLRNVSQNNCLQDIEFHFQGSKVSDMVTCNLVFDESEYEGTGADIEKSLKNAVESYFK